ncbi:hypothetical protein CapIbe_020528 [Capra ibex]
MAAVLGPGRFCLTQDSSKGRLSLESPVGSQKRSYRPCRTAWSRVRTAPLNIQPASPVPTTVRMPQFQQAWLPAKLR